MLKTAVRWHIAMLVRTVHISCIWNVSGVLLNLTDKFLESRLARISVTIERQIHKERSEALMTLVESIHALNRSEKCFAP
jgi:hypothetical protein